MEESFQTLIDEVKGVLGDTKLALLEDLFGHCEYFTEGVSARRFRADREDFLLDLDWLETTILLDRSRNVDDQYIVTAYTLPLLEASRAKEIVSVSDILLCELKKMYKENLNNKAMVEEVLANSLAPRDVALDALYMLGEADSIYSSRSLEFPYEPGSTFNLSERVLSCEGSLAVFCRYYHQIKSPGGNELPNLDVGPWRAEKVEYSSLLFACSLTERKLKKLNHLDENEKYLLIEVESALKNSLPRLAIMGIRALFDLFVAKHVVDHKYFKGSLEALVKEGMVSLRQKEIIAAVFDVGSAAAHRGHHPSTEDIKICIDVYAHLINEIRNLEPRAKELIGRTPARMKK